MPYKYGEIIFDKYRIERLIGEGTFGEVYLVTHTKLNLPRVIKLIHHDAAMKNDPNYREIRSRFQQEAQIGARLDNPALIRVFDFDESDELMSIAMEYAAGGSLQTLMAEKNKNNGSSIIPGIPISRVVEIAAQISGGLAAIHAMDIVHRDLKPSNILFDENGRAKIADLGLAQIKDSKSQSSQGSQQRLPNTHPGTPAYMSPEQEGNRQYLTTASDIYSVGLILFEMLTGRLYKNLRPGTRVTELRPDTPAWLAALVERCLSDDTSKRPWNGEELVKYFQENNSGAIQSTAESMERTSQPKPTAVESISQPAIPSPVMTPAIIPESGKMVKANSDKTTQKNSRLNFSAFFQKFRLPLLISALVLGIILVVLFIAIINPRASASSTVKAPQAVAGKPVPSQTIAKVNPSPASANQTKLDKQIFGKWSVTRVVGFPAKGRPFQDAGNTMEFLSNGIVKILTFDNYSNSYAYSMDGNRVTFTFKDGHKDVWILAYYEFKDGMQLSKEGTEEIMDLSRIQ